MFHCALALQISEHTDEPELSGLRGAHYFSAGRVGLSKMAFRIDPLLLFLL